MNYRPDIDGLRGIAVLAVILFHARVRAVSGGFVGVDVFFVVSGYLITQLVLADIDKGRFSWGRFYERRARRLLPALLAVLLFSSVAAYRLLLPNDLRDYAASLNGALLFCSNFVFWTEAGYFDRPAETKPLLHTWSLGVEEQFYLFYPRFLFLIWRFLRRRYALAISLVLLLSLCLSALTVRVSPKAAFYLAPGRVWELFVGALLALPVLRPINNPMLAGLIGIAGLGLIGYSAHAFSDRTLFPGLSALIPVGGAALVIYSGQTQRSVVARMLTVKPMVFVGLISYSLYLWHWVLLVYVRYSYYRPLSSFETSTVVAAAFVLATLSWIYIEQPVRTSRVMRSGRWLFATAVGAVFLGTAAGGVTVLNDGFPGRLTNEARVLLRGDKDLWGQANGCLNGSYSDLTPKICRVGVDGRDPDFLVWGDSHASAIVPVIDYVARARQLSGATALHTGCAPLLVGSTRVRFVNGSQCREVNLSVWNIIRTTGVKNVLLHARWANYVDHGSDEDLMEVFRMTLLQLQQLHINPIIIASVPEPNVDVPGALARAALSGVPPRTAISESEFAQRQERTFRLLENIAERFSVTIAYPHKVLCSGSICGYVNDRRPLYLDQHHLSVEGAMLLAPLFNGVLGQDLK